MTECVWCQKEITQKELNEGTAWFIMENYSHKSCDSDFFERTQPIIINNKNIVDNGLGCSELEERKHGKSKK